MTQIDIFSGFLGAGKTTLIRKLIESGYQGEKLVLIENEFGDIAIDGGFLQDAGIEITEMNSGCICCTLVGDFTKALRKVIDEYTPDRILIEPSGVGKLSDVAAAVSRVEGAVVGAKVTVVDAGKAKMYQRNFGEFFEDQVANADLLVLSRTDSIREEKLLEAVSILKALNASAGLITTPWNAVSGQQIIEAMRENGLHAELKAMEHHEHHHHHHDDEECDDPECECHHHHHHDDEECDDPECECHHHHHHDHDEDGDHDHEHHEHHHHHDDEECDDPECECHHHHHHADDVFSTWGTETPKKFDEDSLKQKLEKLEQSETYGTVLRAKGILSANEGDWLYFDYVPGEVSIRRGAAQVTGRLCVIGTKLKEDALKELFTIG